MGTLAWHRAANCMRIPEHERPDDWPDSLNLCQLAILQCPEEPDGARAVFLALKSAVERGDIKAYGTDAKAVLDPEGPPAFPTGRVSMTEELVYKLAQFDHIASRTHKDVPRLDREAFAVWLKSEGLQPSKLVKEWLADAWEEEAEEDQGAKSTSERGKGLPEEWRERIQLWNCECKSDLDKRRCGKARELMLSGCSEDEWVKCDHRGRPRSIVKEKLADAVDNSVVTHAVSQKWCMPKELFRRSPGCM